VRHASGAGSATRWEILGHRLRIWTLPRGVEPPPPISRRAKLAALAGSGVTAAVLGAVVIPAIDDAKDRSAARERDAQAAFVTRERARLVADQRARSGRSSAAARLHAAGDDAAARAALLAAARTAIAADARARVAAGTLSGPIREVRCAPEPGDAGARVQLACLAVTGALVGGGGRTEARSGHPFVVSAALRDGRFAWCKENPPPGEGAAATGILVPLPAACTR
jgi:hypothetical protein